MEIKVSSKSHSFSNENTPFSNENSKKEVKFINKENKPANTAKLWSPMELLLLEGGLKSGFSIEEIANNLGRSINAVLMQRNKRIYKRFKTNATDYITILTDFRLTKTELSSIVDTFEIHEAKKRIRKCIRILKAIDHIRLTQSAELMDIISKLEALI